MIGSFLIWMNDCKKPVFTVSTCNDVRQLPPELISRFDEIFFVNLPQFEERRDILSIHLSKMGCDPESLEIHRLAQQSENLSGREIEQALKEALYRAFHLKKALSAEIISGVLHRKTSLLKTMAEQLKYLMEWVGWDPEKKDGIRARYANRNWDTDPGDVKAAIDNLCNEIEQGDPDEPI